MSEQDAINEAILSSLLDPSSNPRSLGASQLSLQEDVQDVVIDQNLVSCAICTDHFSLGQDAKRLPCKHVFHDDCILPWLKSVGWLQVLVLIFVIA